MRSPCTEPPARRRLATALLGALFAALPGCGCADDAYPNRPLQLAPQIIEANASTPCVLEGTSFGSGPVTIRMLDAQGNVVGPVRTLTSTAPGNPLEMLTPILPGLEQDTTVRVEALMADGRVASTPLDVLIRVREPEVRTITGADNQAPGSTVGGAGTALRRDVPEAYEDGFAAPARPAAQSPRAISTRVASQPALPPPVGLVLSDLFWTFGQFLDHDLSLTPEASPSEPLPIAVPTGDPWFDPLATGAATIPLNRSSYLAGTGSGPGVPRRHPNVITGWIDASNVYGSDAVRAAALRTLDGSGRLLTSAGVLLPFNSAGLPNAPTAADPTLFLAGDVRANEQLGLTALHTLFVREHNRVADEIRAANAHLTGDEVYEAARRWVGAQLQVIVHKEWLPALLGAGALPAYAGFDPDVDVSIGVFFSTAAFRLGHTMVGPELWRLDAANLPIPEGNLALRDAFFQPDLLVTEGGIDPVLRGLARRTAERLDAFLVDDLRNFLFGPPGSGGLDLASLNLQRGRDHGLPAYNACRAAYGLSTHADFSAVTSDSALQQAYVDSFGTPDAADPWIVILGEDAVAPALVGETLTTVLKDQFVRLRDGDRFWYQRIFGGEALALLEATRLSDVIRRNTSIGAELSDDVFHTQVAAPLVAALRKPTRSRAALARAMSALSPRELDHIPLR